MMLLPDPQLSDFRHHLESFEGRCDFLYLDGNHHCTIGVGHLLPTFAEARALMPDLTQAEWDAVLTAKPAMGPHYYAALTTCRMPQDAIDALLDTDIAEKSSELTAALPACTAWPPAVRQCLLDFAFNIGAHGLVQKFPHMLAACAAGDWKTAAAESKRNGIQADRNEYTERLLLSAV